MSAWGSGGSERLGRPLRALPPGRARIALERMELAIADKHIALGVLRTGVAAIVVPIAVAGAVVASGAALVLHPLVVMLTGLLVACAGVGAYLLGRGFDELAAVDAQLVALRRRADAG